MSATESYSGGDALAVYTIGHSNHAVGDFVDFLRGAGISAVADVRSKPYSQFTPQFNQAELKLAMKGAGIAYSFLGEELGARPKDRACYRGPIAAYDLISSHPLFQAGLDRIINGAKRFSIALMCMEKDPIDCHRCILVGRNLALRGIAMRHILADGKIEDGAMTELRLVKATRQEMDDMFSSKGADPVARAYAVRGEQIAFAETESDAAQGSERVAS